MSKALSVRPYLKFQKKDSKNLIPIYVQVTIDGDSDVFSLSCKVAQENWDQAKQLCTAKSQEAKNINTKLSVVKGDLTRLFQQFPPGQIVRASQLIAIYYNQDPDRKKQKRKKDPTFYNKVHSLIAKQVALVTRAKDAYRRQLPHRFLQAIDDDRHELSLTAEAYLSETNLWLADPEIEKTLMDAPHAFLLKYLLRVLKGTHSHESLRKWVSTKNVYEDFLKFRYHCHDLPLKAIQLKQAKSTCPQ